MIAHGGPAPGSGGTARDAGAEARSHLPVAVGFLGLFVGTLLLSVGQLGWLPTAAHSSIGLLAIVVVVPLQVLASVWSALTGEPAGAAAMALLATTWAAIGASTLRHADGSTDPALGVLVLATASALALVAVLVSGTFRPGTLVVGTSSVRFVVAGIHQLAGGTAWRTASGVVGLVLAAVAVVVAGTVLFRARSG